MSQIIKKTYKIQKVTPIEQNLTTCAIVGRNQHAPYKDTA